MAKDSRQIGHNGHRRNGRGSVKAKPKPEERTPQKTHVRRWGNQFARSWTDVEIESVADDMLDWFNKQENIWLKDFAVTKMIHRQRFDEWADRNPYFGWIYRICKDIQESKLVKLGLSKKVNQAMPIFALKNVAGWRDVQEFTGFGGGPIQYQDVRDNLSVKLSRMAKRFEEAEKN